MNFALLRSLRMQLVLMFVLIFGAIQTTLSTAALLAREKHLRDFFDQELLNRTQSMSHALVSSQQRFLSRTLNRVINEESRSIYFTEFYVQARDMDGQVIGRSNNLGPYVLPFKAEAAPTANNATPKLETVSGRDVESLAGPHQSLRMVTMLVQEPAVAPFYLQVASNLHHVDESIATVRLLFLIGIPTGLLAAAVASWFVAGKAVLRIEKVGQVARQVTPQRLGQRIAIDKNTDDEVGRMVERINDMLARLEAGFKAQERFIHDASHELKTPLAALISQAQVLGMKQPSSEDYHRFVASVQEEMRHLSRLVESLLMLTRADSRIPTTHNVVSINDVVLAAMQECTPLARQYGIQMQVNLETEEDVGQQGEMMLRGDSDLLSAMVSNLIRNAVRFSPRNKPVQIDVRRQDGSVLIAVRDYGPGIPPDALERIFERFAQADSVGAGASRRGTGLGLSIARSVAQLHHGDLAVRNLENGGCVFTARLPLGNGTTHK